MATRTTSTYDEHRNAGERPASLIARIPRQTFTAMDAQTAAFMAEFIPRLEREANRGWRTDVALTRDLLLHHFNQTASAVLDVCASVEEFEQALYDDILWFTRLTMTHCTFVAPPQEEEWATGLLFYWNRSNPVPKIPDRDRETMWHVGAITAEALCHASLKWQAEAWKRAAAGELANGDPATEGEPGATDGAGSPAKVYKSRAGRNIDKLRKDCGWSFDQLAKRTGIDKSLILGHVNKGKGAHPDTLKTYADAFSKALNRSVTVGELEGEPPQVPPR